MKENQGRLIGTGSEGTVEVRHTTPYYTCFPRLVLFWMSEVNNVFGLSVKSLINRLLYVLFFIIAR